MLATSGGKTTQVLKIKAAYKQEREGGEESSLEQMNTVLSQDQSCNTSM